MSSRYFAHFITPSAVAGAATGTGEAYNAALSGTNTEAVAGVATSTGLALDARVRGEFGTGFGTGAASNASVRIAVRPTALGATGAALDATGAPLGGHTQPNAGLASGVGSAPNPRLHILLISGIGAGAGQALGAEASNIIFYGYAGVGTATGSAANAFATSGFVRITHKLVEAVILPTSSNARLTHKLLEIAHTAIGNLADAVSVTDEIYIRVRTATVTHYVADQVGAQTPPVLVAAHYVADSVLVGPSYLRVTTAGANVLFLPERDARITQSGADILYVPDRAVRATIVGSDVLYQQDPAFTDPLTESLTDYARGVTLEDFTRAANPDGWGTGPLGTWVQTSGHPGKFYTDGSGGIAVNHLVPEEHTNPWGFSRVRLPVPIAQRLEFVTTHRQYSNGVSGIGGIAKWGWEAVDSLDRPLWRIELLSRATTFGNLDLDLFLVSTWSDAITPSYDAFVSTSLGGGFLNPASTAGAGTPASMRVRIDDERIWVRVWDPEATSEPTAWDASHPYTPGLAGGTTYDDQYDAIPSGGAVALNSYAYGSTSGLSHWVRYTQLEFISGFGPTDSVLATVALDVQIGELFDTLVTTDSVNASSNRRRTATETLPRVIDFPYSPDLVTPPGPGWYLFDYFDRDDVDYAADSLGRSSSGWLYPFVGDSGPGTDSSPEYDIGTVLEATDVLLVGNSRLTSADFQYVEFMTPSAGRIALQFDWMWPVAEVPGGPELDWQGDINGYFYVSIDEETPGVWRAFAYMDNATINNSFWSGTPEPNEWFTVRAIFPWGLSIGQAFGVKMWMRGDPEPDDWVVLGTVTAALQTWHPMGGVYGTRGLLSLIPNYAQFTPFINGAPLVIDNLELYDPLERQIPGGLSEVIPIGQDTISYVWTHDPINFPRTVTDTAAIGLTDVSIVVDTDLSDMVVHSVGRVQPPVADEEPLEVQASVVIDDVDLTDEVIWTDTVFSTRTGGGIGTCSIRIRDLDRSRVIVTGSEIVVRYRGVRVWGGYVKKVNRNYAFSYGADDDDRPWPRFLVVEGVDYNILLDTRVLYDKSNPTNARLGPAWPVGTADSTAVIHMIQKQLDLSDLGLGYNIKTTTSVAPYEPFASAHAGFSWNQGMATIADRTRAIYYIDPDKVFHYVDDSVTASRFGWTGLSDQPNDVTTLGYRDFELVYDGSKLVNDQLVWGAGQGSAQMAFWREEDSASITAHGRWQQGEFRQDMYKAESVKRRAQTWIYGSPANRRGHKDDNRFVRATVFEPYFRAGDVVQVHNASFGFTDTIPVRAADISFPTPYDIKVVLTISHEIDPPWNTYEWWMPTPDLEWEFDPKYPVWDFMPQFPEWCPVLIEEDWNPTGPAVAIVEAPPHEDQGRWVQYVTGGVQPAGPDGKWVWIANGRNYMGWEPTPDYESHTFSDSVPSNPILHRIEKIRTGIFGYGWASMWLAGGDASGGRRETRGWQRIVVTHPEGGMLWVRLKLTWTVTAYNSWRQYWMAGISTSITTPIGTDNTSWCDSQGDGDWPEPFHIEGVRDIPDLIDMTSDMMNEEGAFDPANPKKTVVSGVTYAAREIMSGEAIQIGALYTGQEPHDPDPSDPNLMSPNGGLAEIRGLWQVVEVRRAAMTLLVTNRQYDDGTQCFDGTLLWGELQAPMQLTNDPNGRTYRLPGAYAPGSLRVFWDGALLESADYTETDPSAGLITMAYSGYAGELTALYWGTGPPTIDLGDLTLVVPTSVTAGTGFGPQEDYWPPRDWHGLYYEHFHNGVDFANAIGDPVYAAAAGTVRWETQSAGGTMINIHHRPGVSTNYAHLSSRVADDGSDVEQGELIGYTGDSGTVSGPHLHWGLVVNGVPEDPLGVI